MSAVARFVPGCRPPYFLRSERCPTAALTPGSRLAGSGGLLAEQRVGGLLLRIRQARVEAIESGCQTLGVQPSGTC
jgi:hypothetical protein